MKRVVAIIPNYLGGGAETVTDVIVGALNPRGFEFILVTERVVEGCRVRVDRLYSRTITVDIPLAKYAPETTRRLAGVVKPLEADVLWLIGDEFADIPQLRQALRPGGKVIYHLHSVPFFQVGLKDTYHGAPTDRAAYCKWYLLKHLREKLFHSYAKRYFKRTRLTAANVDAFVTLCDSYTRQLAGRYPDLADRFITIYNPAPPAPAAVSKDSKRREILYVGRLSFADKRVDRLLEIFAGITESHPGWHLKIVGDGPERENLERMAAELGLKRVEFCGFSANPSEHLKSASVVCMTSAFEGWPMALVEAMQHGVAPIAYGCSAGVCELLGDGRGIIVPPGDRVEYMNRLGQLIASPDQRNEITAAHPAFLAEVSIEKSAEKWATIFNT